MDYRSRFEEYKSVETRRSDLIEEVLKELDAVKGQLRTVTSESEKAVSNLEADLEVQQDARRGLQETVRALRGIVKTMEEARYVLVLIDADADIYMFHEKYLQRGLAGGQVAADKFMAAVREHLKSLEVKNAGSIPVAVKAYANLGGLAQACVRDKKLTNAGVMSQFWIGFSRRFPLVDFIDVGSGKEEADNKIREVLRVNLSNVQCEHVLLACCHDTGYIPVLRQYAAQESARERITLLSRGRLHSDMSGLGFRATNTFDSLFCSSEPTRAVSPLITSQVRPQISYAQVSSVSQAATGNQTGKHIRSLSSGTPTQEATSPAEENPVSNSARLKSVIKYNEGKRIDKVLKVDKNLVQELQIANLCHWHYLRADCKIEGISCKHNHKFPRPLSSKEFDALWSLSRQNTCFSIKKGKVCEDDQCIYGHTYG